MTKIQLLEEFSLFDGFESKAEAGRAFDHLISIVTKELVAGGSVALGQNFGEFKTATQKAKSGFVPGTDKTYSSPAKSVVKFNASAPLKRVVAGN